MEISDLKEGDLAYVLSGRQNSFFEAYVVVREEMGVKVWVPAKKEHQWYYNSGHADALANDDELDSVGVPKATLVTTTDPRIKILKQRKLFKEHHKTVQDATNAFRKDPTPENGFALTDAVMAWREFSVLSDQFAIRAESIQEYWDLGGSI